MMPIREVTEVPRWVYVHPEKGIAYLDFDVSDGSGRDGKAFIVFSSNETAKQCQSALPQYLDDEHQLVQLEYVELAHALLEWNAPKPTTNIYVIVDPTGDSSLQPLVGFYFHEVVIAIRDAESPIEMLQAESMILTTI